MGAPSSVEVGDDDGVVSGTSRIVGTPRSECWHSIKQFAGSSKLMSLVAASMAWYTTVARSVLVTDSLVMVDVVAAWDRVDDELVVVLPWLMSGVASRSCDTPT